MISYEYSIHIFYDALIWSCNQLINNTFILLSHHNFFLIYRVCIPLSNFITTHCWIRYKMYEAGGSSLNSILLNERKEEAKTPSMCNYPFCLWIRVTNVTVSQRGSEKERESAREPFLLYEVIKFYDKPTNRRIVEYFVVWVRAEEEKDI